MMWSISPRQIFVDIYESDVFCCPFTWQDTDFSHGQIFSWTKLNLCFSYWKKRYWIYIENRWIVTGWNVVLTVCDSAPQWPHWGISCYSCHFVTATSQHTGSDCFVPAVNDNRSSVWNGTLCAVDFFQEPENATGVVGYPVVWPAQVLVMPDVPQWFLLQKDQRGVKRK